MPNNSRALTRAARARAKATNIPYTQARAIEVAIRQRMDEHDCDYGDAEAFVLDPGNELLCAVCGWTYNMICPECSPGCGCVVGCTGWRHGEYGIDEDDGDERECECGASHEYHCVCA